MEREALDSTNIKRGQWAAGDFEACSVGDRWGRCVRRQGWGRRGEVVAVGGGLRASMADTLSYSLPKLPTNKKHVRQCMQLLAKTTSECARRMTKSGPKQHIPSHLVAQAPTNSAHPTNNSICFGHRSGP